jgi:putative FmdB family regulatory protein
MPIYEYRCSGCGSRFEKILPRSSSPAPPCPSCGAKKPEKLISAPGSVGVATSPGPSSCPASGADGCPAGSGFG